MASLLTDTLKLILALTPPPQTAKGRIAQLFNDLRRQPPPRPPHEIEDEVWARWTSHADARLETLMQKSIAATARRDYDTANVLLDDLVRAAPDWSEAWNKRATLHYLAGRDDASIADIRATLEREPQHFGAICGFAQICLRLGEPAAASSAFAVALAIHPHLDGVRAALAAMEPRPMRLN